MTNNRVTPSSTRPPPATPFRFRYIFRNTKKMQWLIFPFLPLMVACMTTGLLPLTDELLEERLYTSIIVAKYDRAVTQTIELEADSKGQVISQVVDRLLVSNKINIMEYAYQLWIDNEAKQIVEKYFPVQFKLIVNENYVELLHKKTGELLEMTNNSEYESNDTKASIWKFIPFWENNRVYFKFQNIVCSSYLYLNDHTAYGTTTYNDITDYQWYFQPAIHENDMMFFIINLEFHEALEMKYDNANGTEYGHTVSNNVEDSADKFRWFILPADHEPVSINCFN